MTTQAETSTSNGLNAVKWVFALSILIAATVGNRYAPELFPQLSVWVRGVVLVVMVLAALALTLITTQGKSFLKLLSEAQVEARRIVWPTKDETMQTTLIVCAVVLMMSLMLWGVDSLFGWMISAVIG
ncbi:MAG: preprotein translocase subunit SecE [Agitococcus sp.]|jgi:preprotein translocase subunit SecE|nr:preprotein translocase subunit SecE [Moraxellaceae bacterium]MBK7301418.1 preprotein translocase subunit SecE [Moraxellaceae bacterium]MBK9185478.1 preprotein translocase subunit SecE [Moraxellaceae bacterium]MBL0230290.1 preprotein translocase subunit SecE [Moraxellaceae bacterium]MBP9216175.1 preprotein translocase subunit SecE [Agitococcus sp.]